VINWGGFGGELDTRGDADRGQPRVLLVVVGRSTLQVSTVILIRNG
jgi:hypothetical protein